MEPTPYVFLAVNLAFLAGVTRTVSRMVNTQLAQQIGNLHSTYYNYFIGLLCSLLALLVSWKALPATPPLQISPIPWWAYWGGAVGVLFVYLANLTTRHISAFSLTLLIFIGQIATGTVIDALFFQRFQPGKVFGGGLILTGLLVNHFFNRPLPVNLYPDQATSSCDGLQNGLGKL
ncbi:MAG: DMT family transporter [Blastocatellia bacterium]|nr:DMT family transporter [Blastocatellia bacterium]